MNNRNNIIRIHWSIKFIFISLFHCLLCHEPCEAQSCDSLFIVAYLPHPDVGMVYELVDNEGHVIEESEISHGSMPGSNEYLLECVPNRDTDLISVNAYAFPISYGIRSNLNKVSVFLVKPGDHHRKPVWPSTYSSPVWISLYYYSSAGNEFRSANIGSFNHLTKTKSSLDVVDILKQNFPQVPIDSAKAVPEPTPPVKNRIPWVNQIKSAPLSSRWAFTVCSAIALVFFSLGILLTQRKAQIAMILLIIVTTIAGLSFPIDTLLTIVSSIVIVVIIGLGKVIYSHFR